MHACNHQQPRLHKVGPRTEGLSMRVAVRVTFGRTSMVMKRKSWALL